MLNASLALTSPNTKRVFDSANAIKYVIANDWRASALHLWHLQRCWGWLHAQHLHTHMCRPQLPPRAVFITCNTHCLHCLQRRLQGEGQRPFDPTSRSSTPPEPLCTETRCRSLSRATGKACAAVLTVSRQANTPPTTSTRSRRQQPNRFRTDLSPRPSASPSLGLCPLKSRSEKCCQSLSWAAACERLGYLVSKPSSSDMLNLLCMSLGVAHACMAGAKDGQPKSMNKCMYVYIAPNSSWSWTSH